MFRKIEDFERTWAHESEATLKILRALSEGSLGQSAAPGGRSLGRLAWHLTLTLPEMMKEAGLPVAGPPQDAPLPALAEIIREYEISAGAVGAEVKGKWTDAMLAEAIPMYGEQWPRGVVLTVLISHQAHHRGQMTVLMRQAGLRVPGVYGPAREDWAALGMPPQE